MGILDKLRSGRHADAELSPQSGLLLAALTMVAIDGHLDDDELAIVDRLKAPGDNKSIDQALQMLRRNSVENCVELVSGTLSDEQKLATIANLVDIAMADGHLADAEETLLEHYIHAFNLPRIEVEKIVDVIAVKNNRDIFVA